MTTIKTVLLLILIVLLVVRAIMHLINKGWDWGLLFIVLALILYIYGNL